MALQYADQTGLTLTVITDPYANTLRTCRRLQARGIESGVIAAVALSQDLSPDDMGIAHAIARHALDGLRYNDVEPGTARAIIGRLASNCLAHSAASTRPN